MISIIFFCFCFYILRHWKINFNSLIAMLFKQGGFFNYLININCPYLWANMYYNMANRTLLWNKIHYYIYIHIMRVQWTSSNYINLTFYPLVNTFGVTTVLYIFLVSWWVNQFSSKVVKDSRISESLLLVEFASIVKITTPWKLP